MTISWSKISNAIFILVTIIFFSPGCSPPSDQSHEIGQESTEEDEDHHHHDEDLETPGPNGGRLVELKDSNFEIFIDEERRIEFRLLDENLTEIPHAAKHVSIITGDRQSPIEFELSSKSQFVLSSTNSIPEGNSTPVILKVTDKESNSTLHVEKFTANLSNCPTCDYLEYACICGH